MTDPTDELTENDYLEIQESATKLRRNALIEFFVNDHILKEVNKRIASNQK